ncbi:hypothetical protein [Salipiger mangrovisoli]|uniref:Nucleotide-binding universal stress protein, UspA family n=1 Tax=Salipiger mangrovisoli TaxID=2865933 RepID=A0ABR9X5F1_9RHOB|nr:hypothetical protein [Salipiger mangrovisoli]MBE9638781.1 hypothetical protein [Salipiger mangrovisoli]
MKVQTVLTYFDGSNHGREQLQAAIDAALWFDAQLTVVSVVYVPNSGPGSFGPLDPDPAAKSARVTASILARRVSKWLEEAGVRGDAFPFAASKATFAREFSSLARYVDVVVELHATADLRASLSSLTGQEISAQSAIPMSGLSGVSANTIARVGVE